jgi:hypothetical protein
MRNRYNDSALSFYNASGDVKTDVVMEKLSKLIVNEPKAVVLAIQNAGLDLPINSSSQSITKTIMLHKGNERLIDTLSAVILLSEEYNSFFKGKAGGALAGGGASAGGGGFADKIGGFFKKSVNTDGTKGTSKFGSWFKNNKGSIGNIGGALAGGLFANKRQGGNPSGRNTGGGNTSGGNTGGGNTGGGNTGGEDTPPMSMGVKIAIGGGVLLLIAGVVLVMRNKSKQNGI